MKKLNSGFDFESRSCCLYAPTQHSLSGWGKWTTLLLWECASVVGSCKTTVCPCPVLHTRYKINPFSVAAHVYVQTKCCFEYICACQCVCDAFSTASFLSPLGDCKSGWYEGNLTAQIMLKSQKQLLISFNLPFVVTLPRQHQRHVCVFLHL